MNTFSRTITFLLLSLAASVVCMLGASYVASCTAARDLQRLDSMTDAEFGLVAEDWAADAQLLTIAALREGFVEPEHALAFAAAFGSVQPSQGDVVDQALELGSLTEGLVVSITAKLRRRIFDAGGWPLGSRGQILLTRVADAIRTATQRHLAFSPSRFDEDRGGVTPPSGEQQADGGGSDG